MVGARGATGYLRAKGGGAQEVAEYMSGAVSVEKLGKEVKRVKRIVWY